MVIVRNSHTALSAAIACQRANLSAKEGLAAGLWDADPDWGWNHHEVQQHLDSGAAARVLKSIGG